MTRAEWMDGARCTTTDPDLFMPECQAQRDAAIAICNRCTVLDQCLAWAQTLDTPHGVIAGIDWDHSPDRDQRRHALYQRGFTDSQIAGIEDVSRNTIATWRNQRQLPPNVNPMGPKARSASHRRTEWHSWGWTDQQMADKEGIKPHSIERWRLHHRLPRNTGSSDGRSA